VAAIVAAGLLAGGLGAGGTAAPARASAAAPGPERAGAASAAALVPGDDPVVGVASTADGEGYWLATAAGAVHPFGTAGFHGDLRGIALTRPVVGIAATATSRGYWLVAADGGIFTSELTPR